MRLLETLALWIAHLIAWVMAHYQKRQSTKPPEPPDQGGFSDSRRTPMEVTRITDGNESRVEPPLEQEWSDRQKLEWHAAVAEYDTGLRVRIADGHHRYKQGGRWVEDEPYYSIQVGGSSTVYNFHGAWIYINGISAGARAVRP